MPLFWPTPCQRKSSFPETEEKVRRLKRKNAELAVIAKRLEGWVCEVGGPLIMPSSLGMICNPTAHLSCPGLSVGSSL